MSNESIINSESRTHSNPQFIKMTTEPVSKLILSLAVPTVISMLVSSIYNMADTFFVSKLGTSATAAVGIVFSVMAIIQAVGFTLGMGCGSLVSRRLGEKNVKAANKYASSAFFASFAIGILVLIVGFSFTDTLMELLGSTPTVLPYSRAYAHYIFLGAPIMCSSFVMNNVLRSEGHASFSMIALTSGGVLNILLDPLFIFTFKLGTAGAAIATLISQCISFAILLQFFLRHKGLTSISIRFISKKFSDYASIVTTGFPSLCRQGLASVSSVLLNREAAIFGDVAIAGMSVVTRIVILIGSIMVGIGQGFTPVAGYNYGAKNFKRVKDSYKFTVILGFITMSFFAAILMIFAPTILSWFAKNLDVIKVGSTALRFQAGAIPLNALIIGTNMLMQATGKSIQATFLACNRQGVYFIPAILILPHLFGLLGVEVSQTIADILSAITAVPYVIWFFKNNK